MRIGHHIALQTSALVLATLGWGALQVYQRLELTEMSDVTQGDSRDLEAFGRLQDTAGHFLLLGDLVFSGETTYLVAVASEQSSTIRALLAEFADRPLFQGYSGDLGRIAEQEQDLLALILEAEASGQGRSDDLGSLLLRFDDSAMDFTGELEELALKLDEEAELRAQDAAKRMADGELDFELGALALLGSILLSWSYLRRVLAKPIERLNAEVNASQEHDPASLTQTGPTEIQRLAASFQALMDRNGQALVARSAFLANTSHELRTPLNSILGFTNLMAEPDTTAEEHKEYLEHVRFMGTHLLSLIEDVLDLSKIDAGHLQLEQTGVGLRTLLKEVQGAMAKLAEDRGLELRLGPLDELPRMVQGDSVRLRQILINLVSNAIKFTEQGTVSLRSSWRDAVFVVEVEDTGIGIPAEKIESVFADFEQVDVSTTRRFGGTGLGLAISRNLARMMGGDLTAESRVGEGSIFRLEIQAQEIGSDSEPALDREGAVTGGSESSTDGGQSPELVGPGGPRPGARVLLVDDVPANRLLGRRILERMELTVEEACDGQDALRVVRAAWTADEPFEVILMDLQMPILDGYHATREILAEGFDVPIIALSAAVMPEHRAQALDSGCVDFLGKPLKVDALQATLGRYVPVLNG